MYVLPEDDANRQLADGFVLHHQVKEARVQVMPPAGGWSTVLQTFQDEYLPRLGGYPQAHVVLLIDFDGQIESRRSRFAEGIPEELKPRVFVIGMKDTPEALKAALRQGFEQIGARLADDCGVDSAGLWDHDQLSHNEGERQRLVQTIKPILFS
ncbi:MAG TPA: hypothetical protein VFW87_23340 [Pirellulales bacterium]|nr:hypothetical protein [Pirellulales bacterium]